MDRSATILVAVVGAGIVVTVVARRVAAERRAAETREPFIGLAELARRIQARRGSFGSSVTGIDVRQPFDAGFFGGLPAAAGPGPGVEDTGETLMLVEPFSVGGGNEDTPAFGIPNTAPQDFTEAQFAAAKFAATDPSVRATVSAFKGDLVGVVANAIEATMKSLGLPSPTAAIKDGVRALGLPGALAPSLGRSIKTAVEGVRLSLGLAGVPTPAIPAPPTLYGLLFSLSEALGKFGVDAAFRARATADPSFPGRVQAELDAMRADPARFFNTLANPPQGQPVAPPTLSAALPTISFSTPRGHGGDEPDAAPDGPTSGSPGGTGEPGGPPGGPGPAPGDAPAGVGPGTGPAPSGVTAGEVGGLAAQGESPTSLGNFQGGELSLGLSPTPTPAPASPTPDPGGSGGGGGGGVGAGGGGDSGPGGESP